MPVKCADPEERERVKRYRPQLLLLLGAAITMASIAWELARMNPQTSYIVDPWSIRGYESVHGSIAFTIGALVFAAGLLTMLEKSLNPLYSRLIGFAMVVGAVGVAAIYGTDERTMGGGAVGWLVAIGVSWIIKGLVAPRLPEQLASGIKTFSSLAIVIVSAFVLNLALFGREFAAKPVVWVGIAALVIYGLAATGKPSELAANRMLIFSTVFGGATVALGAAAVRANLIAALHIAKMKVTEPDRLKQARQHLLNMVDASKAMWISIQAETDNNKEWLPSPKQDSVTGVKITEDMVKGWHQFLGEYEAILNGKKLVPHWRFTQTSPRGKH